ncbi:hypothetical protein BH23VER1_BH23VER1_11950 [soil metagenome]
MGEPVEANETVAGANVLGDAKTITRNYDTLKRPEGYTVADCATTIQDVTFGFDSAGRVGCVAEGVDSIQLRICGQL